MANCDKSDCFANKPGGCAILLTSDFYNGTKCPFYKTAKTLERERKAADERCEQLGIKKRSEAYE